DDPAARRLAHYAIPAQSHIPTLYIAHRNGDAIFFIARRAKSDQHAIALGHSVNNAMLATADNLAFRYRANGRGEILEALHEHMRRILHQRGIHGVHILGIAEAVGCRWLQVRIGIGDRPAKYGLLDVQHVYRFPTTKHTP